MIQWLVQLVRQIGFKLDFAYEAIRMIVGILRLILDDLKQSLANDDKIIELEQQNQALLKQILAEMTPHQPTKFSITLIGGNMAKQVKASVDFQLLDNGTAKAVATPDDAAGLPAQLPAGTTVPSWTSSDPGVVVTPDPSDASGLTATVAPATPPVLVTGAVITVSATLPDSTVITGQSDPIDVVGGPATGFKIALQ